MPKPKRSWLKSLVLGAAAAGALGAAAGAAHAEVVCGPGGDCWHVHSRYGYPGRGYAYHPDDWYFHRTWEGGGPYRWHEYHQGRGYWRDGAWRAF